MTNCLLGREEDPGAGGKKGDFQTDTLDQLTFYHICTNFCYICPILPHCRTFDLHHISSVPYFYKKGDFQPDTLPAYLLPHLHQKQDYPGCFFLARKQLYYALCALSDEKKALNLLFIMQLAQNCKLQGTESEPRYTKKCNSEGRQKEIM